VEAAPREFDREAGIAFDGYRCACLLNAEQLSSYNAAIIE
jgi:hypothetical protein